MCLCVCVWSRYKLHDYDLRPKSVCLCKTEDFLQLRKKKEKKMSKKRRTEECHNVLYQIPLASRATNFD